MKKTSTIILLVVAGLFWYGTAVWYPSRNQPVNVTGYKKLARPNYMKYCTDGDTRPEVKQYCECTFDYLDRNITDQRMKDLDERANRNESILDVPEVSNAINFCTDTERGEI